MLPKPPYLVSTKNWRRNWEREEFSEFKEMIDLSLFVFFSKRYLWNWWLYTRLDTNLHSCSKISMPMMSGRRKSWIIFATKLDKIYGFASSGPDRFRCIIEFVDQIYCGILLSLVREEHSSTWLMKWDGPCFTNDCWTS